MVRLLGMPTTIRWRLVALSLLAVGVPLLCAVVYLNGLLWNFYIDQLRSQLMSTAALTSEMAATALEEGEDSDGLSAVVERWDHHMGMRFVICDTEGKILAATSSSVIPRGSQVSEATAPGLREALSGATNATTWRRPDSDFAETMYVNTPILGAGAEILGALRVSYSLGQINDRVSKIQSSLSWGLAGYAIAIISLTLALAARFAKPVEILYGAARRIARGELDHKVTVKGPREYEQLAQSLNTMTERLAHLEGLRRKYVSDVSHELRAPLAAIRSMAETLVLHGPEDPELSCRYLPRIIEQTERLARLASQLLDLDQIESGAIARSLSAVALDEVVEEAVATALGGRADELAKVTLELEEMVPVLFADRDRLVQMVLNLVGNALSYTPPSGTVTVTVAKAAPKGVEIRVADSGKGIPPTHLPNLFDRFYRVDSARTPNRGGAGLGLAIVKQIVESHGGTIEVTSAVGRGTTFRVYLPLEGNTANG